MSGFGDPGPQHRNAVARVDDARERAQTALSEVRQRAPPTHHPYLAPADSDSVELSVMATQAVVDYLIQLRPYRGQSKNWQANLGSITLPKTVRGREPPRRGQSPGVELHICRDPQVTLDSVDKVVKAANMTVQYSSVPVDRQPRTRGEHELKTGTDEFGTLLFDDESMLLAAYNGNISYEEAVEFGAAVPKNEVQSRDEPLTLGDPSPATSGRGSTTQVEDKNLVYPESVLKDILEIADAVADEMDLLLERDNPDYEPGGGGAV